MKVGDMSEFIYAIRSSWLTAANFKFIISFASVCVWLRRGRGWYFVTESQLVRSSISCNLTFDHPLIQLI